MNTHPPDDAEDLGLLFGSDKKALSKALVARRQSMPDHAERSLLLQRVLRTWLVERGDASIGFYWPIKGEFDALPGLFRWLEAGRESDAVEAIVQRRIGLPVVDKEQRTLKFHVWYPGCPMEEDAYGIPKPKGTDTFEPTLLFVPCVGYGPGGYRLGYGGGFYDRTLSELSPKPFTVGLGFANAFLPDLAPEPHDVPLDAILNENGLVWPLPEPSHWMR